MNKEEYEARKAELSAEAETARTTLNEARRAYDKICDQLQVLRIEWREEERKNDRLGMVPFETHRYAGSTRSRAERGKPGHCKQCAQHGHVKAHPQLGCADVGCESHHPETEE